MVGFDFGPATFVGGGLAFVAPELDDVRPPAPAPAVQAALRSHALAVQDIGDGRAGHVTKSTESRSDRSGGRSGGGGGEREGSRRGGGPCCARAPCTSDGLVLKLTKY